MDMAALEIDKEDVPRQKEMEKEGYEEEVQPYRKMDYKQIIYIFKAIDHTYSDLRIENRS